MLWYPAFAAFRAGQVTGTQWDSTSSAPNVGPYSAAFGYNTVASGNSSFAWGNTSLAGWARSNRRWGRHGYGNEFICHRC